MEFDLATYLIVCPLVFLGAFVDAIAGGGGLIALPAYLLAGVPPHMALGSNKLSSSVGTMVSTWRIARAGFLDLRRAWVAVIFSFAGSVLGARLALLVPEDAFRLLLILALPVVAFFVVFRRASLSDESADMPNLRRLAILAGCGFGCGLYDGFYGPGAGTFMLITFCLLGKIDVRSASGEMKAANLASNIAALVTFALAGQVAWALGLTASLFSVAGHYVGAGMMLQNGTRIVRPIIVVVLVLLFAKTIWDLLAPIL